MKALIKSMVKWLGYEFVKLGTEPSEMIHGYRDTLLDAIIWKHIDVRKVRFIQIGAYDGKTLDPINKFVSRFNWRGCVLEPIPHIFKLLKDTYSNNSEVKCLRLAVAKTSGPRRIFTVDPKHNLAKWTQVLSSFDKNTLIKHSTPGLDLEPHVVEEVIECKTIQEVFLDNKNFLEGRVDLIQIDTEGHDYEIIKTIPFDLINPSIINYESVHLSMKDKIEAIELLKSHGYRIAEQGWDTTAYKDDKLGFTAQQKNKAQYREK